MLNIALNTFKEIIRNKFLYLIIIFAILLILFSLALGQLSLGENNKIIIDFGIAMIEIFGIIGVLFVGSQLLFKEIEGKTIYLILSKPIKRYEFVLGKFLGFGLVLFLIVLIQSLVFLLILFINNISIDYLIMYSLIFIFLKTFILIGIVLFLSTFMSNILTIIISIMIYLGAHSFSLLIDMAIKLENKILEIIIKIVQLAFPPFEAMNIKDYIGSFIVIENSYFLLNIIYSLVYLIIILFFTNIIFNKKTFEN